MEHDAEAYNMLHHLTADWPVFSFEVIPDAQGAAMRRFPHTLYLACGTQADSANKNRVLIQKLSQLGRMPHDDDSSSDEDEDDENDDESDSDSDEDLDCDPIMETQSFAHAGGVNRLRLCPQQPNWCMTMSESKKVSRAR